MAKKKKGGEGGANWMDTYGDMVTLLLCFFVLLYSMSTISEDKMKAIIQSFNPNATLAVTDPSGVGGPYADPEIGDQYPGIDQPDPNELAQADIDAMIEELYQAINDMVAQDGLASTIQVDMDGGQVYIHFSDAVFFAGDSYVIQPQGQDILSKLCAILDTAEPAIDEIRVQGHTAQATANERNPVEGDRRLASNRSAEVVIFLQEHSSIHPARLINEGYGQWRPISSNATGESRAHNRRVEMIITGVDLNEEEMNDILAQYITRSDEDGGLHSTGSAD